MRQTLILLFSFRFLSSHIHLRSAVTDFIWIADTVMKTDLNLLNTFKKEFVAFSSGDPGGAVRSWGPYVSTWSQSYDSSPFLLRVSGQCCSCKEVLKSQLSQRRRGSVSFTDGSRSKRQAEQTCLIKRKRREKNFFDACLGCAVTQYYMGFFSVRCSSRGWVRRRCCRHKEGGEDEAPLMKFLIIPPPLAQGVASECHLGQRSLWSHIYEIHLSLSFLSLFLFFLLRAGSFSPSALIGGAVKVYGVSASSR